jgi:hypothetical protein
VTASGIGHGDEMADYSVGKRLDSPVKPGMTVLRGSRFARLRWAHLNNNIGFIEIE